MSLDNTTHTATLNQPSLSPKLFWLIDKFYRHSFWKKIEVNNLTQIYFFIHQILRKQDSLGSFTLFSALEQIFLLNSLPSALESINGQRIFLMRLEICIQTQVTAGC